MKAWLIAATFAVVSGSMYAAALTDAEAKGFKIVKTLFRDDYEKADAKREGNPQLFRAPVSNGLLELTGLARCRTSGSVEFGFARRRFRTPENGRRFFAFGFRLYSLESGTAEILCTSATSSFSVRLLRAPGDAVACRIVDCGRNAAKFDLPTLPADVMLYARKDGGYAVTATSLADGGVRMAFGDVGFFREEFADGFDARVKLSANGGEARLVLDNLVVTDLFANREGGLVERTLIEKGGAD